MKKLMIAAAVAAGIAGQGFCLESANTVGYTTPGLRENIQLLVATFEDVGSAGMDIQNIIPLPPDGETATGDGCFDLQTLLSTGAMDEQFFYMNPDDGDAVPEAGWYAMGGVKSTKVFDPGEGFMLYSYYDGASVQFAGEVHLEAIDVPLGENIQLQGNIRPMNVSIQKLVPQPPAGETATGDGCFDLQTLLATGAMDEQFFYMNPDDGDAVAEAGWYAMGGVKSTKVFAPGEGFMIYSYYDGAALRFTAE